MAERTKASEQVRFKKKKALAHTKPFNTEFYKRWDAQSWGLWTSCMDIDSFSRQSDENIIMIINHKGIWDKNYSKCKI